MRIPYYIGFLLFAFIMPILGCGGGGAQGGGNPTPVVSPAPDRTTPVKYRINWGDRTRALNAPPSALSAVVKLAGADPTGADLVSITNRDLNQLNSYSQDVTSEGKVKPGTWQLRVDFHADANGQGAVVGTGGATVSVDANGSGIGDVATTGTIGSVHVGADSMVKVGETADLPVAAYGADGTLIAVSPGSFRIQVVSGDSALKIVNGRAQGVALGNAEVVASVDDKGSPPANVIVASADDPETGAVRFSRTLAVSGDPVTLSDAQHNVSLSAPGQAFSNATSLSLEVRDHQSDAAIPAAFQANPNPVELHVNSDDMSASGTIQVAVPVATDYEETGSMMVAVNPEDASKIATIPVVFDSDNNQLVGVLDKQQLLSLQSSRKRGRSLLSQVVRLFVATIRKKVTAASGRFFVFDHGSFHEKGPGDSMAGKRIALVLHGITSDHSAMKDVCNFLDNGYGSLSLPNDSGGNGKPFDQVWCYEYNWMSYISDSGDRFAQDLQQVMPGAASIEIHAWSMGGLVSRWALEKRGLGGSINRLITYDTPHEGVPAQAFQFFLWIVAQYTDIDVAAWLPGINDLVAKGSILGISTENPLSPSFLKRLNDGVSPYRSAAEYFTLAGDSYADMNAPVKDMGTKINDYYYNAGDLSDTIKHDGIVPVYSAYGDTVLPNKSQSWSASPGTHRTTVPLNHIYVVDFGGGREPILTNALRPWILSGAVKGAIH